MLCVRNCEMPTAIVAFSLHYSAASKERVWIVNLDSNRSGVGIVAG
jgi:hypothetical protein